MNNVNHKNTEQLLGRNMPYIMLIINFLVTSAFELRHTL